MKPLAALSSVMTTAAFHASKSGEIIESNPSFVQLMRCIPGDDWRLNVDDETRTALNTFWEQLFSDPYSIHQPAAFTVNGSESSYQIRAQAVTNDDGEFDSAVGVVMVDESSMRRWKVDGATGLPEHDAVVERFEELMGKERSFVAAVILLEPASPLRNSDSEPQRTEAARHLLSVLRPTDLLASDVEGRFLLCAAGINSSQAALALAERLISSLNTAQIGSRVGLAFPNAGVAVATMVREAEAGAWASAPNSSGFAPQEEAA